MRHVIAAALLVLFSSSVTAGELGISWDEVSYPYPITYEIFRDGTPILQTLDTSLLISAADNCVISTYTITATGAVPGNPLTSGASTPMLSMARPTLASILFNANGVHQIIGENFPTNAQVEVDGVEVTTGVNRLSCQLIEIPTTAGTPSTITVINPQSSGQLSATWALPPPVTPSNTGVF